VSRAGFRWRTSPRRPFLQSNTGMRVHSSYRHIQSWIDLLHNFNWALALSTVWPFKTAEDKYEYQRMVNSLFRQRKFPDVTGLIGGRVVMGCWTKKYRTVQGILRALEVEMPIDDDK